MIDICTPFEVIWHGVLHTFSLNVTHPNIVSLFDLSVAKFSLHTPSGLAFFLFVRFVSSLKGIRTNAKL